MDSNEMLKKMLENLPSKTGKSLEEWKEVLKTKDFKKHSEGVNFLKKEHQVTHGFANTIVTLFREDGQETVDLLQAQYAGKEALYPIYQKVLAAVNQFGNDITVTPKKTSVSIIRKKQFVLVKPATKTRIDLGLKLPNKPVGDRLGNSGPFGTMCTHRVKLSSASEVDEELIAWMKEAYELSV